MSQHKILLVDDDRHVLESMSDWLRLQGFEITTAASYREAIQTLGTTTFDLALIDVRLADGDGYDLLAQCKKNWPDTNVILMTGYGTADAAIQAIRAGAFDYLTKPLIDEELLMAIERAFVQREVLEENTQLRTELDRQFGIDNIIGHDPKMNHIFDMIESIADTRATVLVTGESGTGKSMIARAIHRQSSRANGPFVEIACGALPENLLESELFGHVAGAFTGATKDKDGKFLLADGGTIFLDEIGTASQAMQVKLLRVLQELEFEAVGGAKTHKVDVRVVLATNENLLEAVSKGSFRQDLYYRINVINIELPSLKERLTDIPLLAQKFLEEVSEDTPRPVRRFTPDAMTALQQYDWPGNVRELQNIVERSVLLGKGELVTLDELPVEVRANSSREFSAATMISTAGQPLTLKEALEEPERQIILAVLRSHHWNRNLTAEELGINRTTLYKKMKKLGLESMQSNL